MNVTIVGPGNMGRGIATRLLAGGHSVVLVGRDREQAEALARELGSHATEGSGVRAAEGPGEAIPASDVVVLALPYQATLAFVRESGGLLAGNVVVDISNPLNERFDGLVTEGGPSAAETIRGMLPGARVVKAFNTTFAGTLVTGTVAGRPLDVFIAGDDEEANERVAGLVRAGGMRAIPLGPLERSRQLEALGFLGIASQERLGTSFMSGWKLLLPGTPADEPHHGFPKNAVVGVFDNPAAAAGIASACAAAGVEDAVEVLYGSQGKTHIARSMEGGRGVLEMLMGYEHEHAERHLRELDAGHAVVVVQTDDEAMAQRVGEVMARHGGRFVNRYTRWAAVSVVP
ncbi:MAG TPA: NAD(P)-binding domain-containing protein [Longimicrobium sp.]